MFRAMCEAKANKYGRDVRIISRWQPTSQICADCGYQWGKLDLSIREIICLGCGKVECRDSNASRSIDRIGLGHSHDGYKWAGSGHKTSAEAIHDELSTRKLEWEQLALPI